MYSLVNTTMADDFSTRPKLGISACLLGQAVRFDGGHKRDAFLTETFAQFVDWVPICPEVEAGMGVPRESVRLIRNGTNVRMVAERSGRDWTGQMQNYAAKRIATLKQLDLSGFVFMKNSPSCGVERVRLYTPSRTVTRNGRGMFAKAIINEFPFLPVEEQGRLDDPALRENFVERVFAYNRWQVNSRKKSIRALVVFHTRHKLLLLAHSEKRYRRLGRLVATAKSSLAASYEGYGREFMEALTIKATPKKHANVLHHMMGYFSQELSRSERQELLGVISDFHQQLVPLTVPITLIRHFALKYAVGYLLNQTYLEPSPKEMMLRNHV
jgi:uncharacterized protein YbgA (DUF1722 family)/uncharacterized protein YbbK (DUF523 family)